MMQINVIIGALLIVIGIIIFMFGAVQENKV